MAVDMAIELRKKNVCVVSLWPGAVITELIDNQVKQGEKVRGLMLGNAKILRELWNTYLHLIRDNFIYTIQLTIKNRAYLAWA